MGQGNTDTTINPQNTGPIANVTCWGVEHQRVDILFCSASEETDDIMCCCELYLHWKIDITLIKS